MSIQRLKDYKSGKGPKGATHGKIERIDPWSARATANSGIAPRASDGPVKLTDTDKAVKTRNTGSKPFASRKIEAAMAGDGDVNHVGSMYMRGVRRT